MSSAIEWSPNALTFLTDGAVRSRISSVASAIIAIEGDASNTCRLTGLSLPLFDADAANKSYVDALVGGGGACCDYITGTTDSTSPTTGAFRVAGGIGVVKNVHCGANMYAQAFVATSDARLKTHVRDAADIAARLAKVRARSYEFRSQPGRERIGVLAQDLLAAGVDSSVFRTETGALAVDYNAITALLLSRGVVARKVRLEATVIGRNGHRERHRLRTHQRPRVPNEKDFS